MIKRILQGLVVVLILVSLVGGIIFFLPAKTTNEQRIFTSKEISNLKEISLDGDFDVNVTTSESKDTKCTFSKTKRGYVSNEYELESNIENNVLYITTNSKSEPSFVLGGETLNVNIDIPKSYKNKLSIKSKLAKINILNSNSEDIECSTTDGETRISLDKICGNITVDTHLGDIDLKLPKDEKFNLSSAKSRFGKVTNNLDSNVDYSMSEKNINLSSSDGNITISGN
ncbi:DUF4097 family beta strand repeat-containing protein [Clostridium beijerinckii]|uniref:DUF4097 family beta strand repeat-containing protein n=1 Tax=Clostridium beijerinckii TaxID=1520 RepID=UPI00080A1C32|nr:DUF4097 family beta strand repeat-containing protein [Clostridium beijerinckii]OCA96625.1 hypothetical protein BGS1_07250 [Clostridium beijerinckii]